MNKITLIQNKTEAEIQFGKVKEEIFLLSERVSRIEIKDEASLQLGTQLTTELNQVVKKIEEKRKLLKQPYLDSGKIIDKVAKELSEPAEKAIQGAKSKILSFQKELIRIQAEKQAEIERQQKEAQAKIEKAAAEKEAKIKEINDWFQSIKNLIIKSKTKDELSEASTKLKSIPFKIDINEESDIYNLYKGLNDELIDLGAEKYTLINEINKLKKENTDQSNAKAELLMQKIKLLEKEIDIESESIINETKNTIESDINEEMSIIDSIAINQKVESEVSFKGPSTRKTYKFELVDKNACPKAWLTLDESKVREWIKTMSADPDFDMPKDGEIFQGIKFIHIETPILR